MKHKEVTIIVVLTFSAEILRVNDDLSRVLEYYRKIFGLAPGVSPRTEPIPPSTTQTADVQELSITGPASTLIDLGVGGQTAESAETPASSVLENELKALGKYCGIYVNHGCRVKRREA